MTVLAEGAPPATPPTLVDRELSWLEFNGRVLQEASDPDVPLFERLAFLGIFASNLDEFYRVRVAGLRTLLRLKKKRVARLSLDPRELLRAIHDVVSAHHAWFRRIFDDELVPALAERGIVLTDERRVCRGLRARVAALFESSVRPHLEVLRLRPGAPAPALENDAVYLAVELFPLAPLQIGGAAPDVALVRVPSPPLPRFITFDGENGSTRVLFLDDVLRLHLADLFPGRRVVGAWAIQVSRDAELEIEASFDGDVVAAIRRSLAKRECGALTRFLFDPEMPVGVLSSLESALFLEPEDLVEGGRYPNLGDLTAFPRRCAEDCAYPDWPTVDHPDLSTARPVAEAVREADRLLHFPYHDFDHVVRFLTEAAHDPAVESIRLTVYRVSEESPVMKALIAAAEQGKDVRVFVEAKARFDEESNLRWAARLEECGIVTHYSFPDLKVHAKVALVTRRTEQGLERQAYLGTGNFNEQTARQYTDFGLLTADSELTLELERVFHFLEGRIERPVFEHLLVAPFGMRERFVEMVEEERRRARRGEPAAITVKVNALEDTEMIAHLQAAALDGVRVAGIVRGICRWQPDGGLHGEAVHFRSIVDRYLEHGRAFVFHSGGERRVFLGSADWMHRNLSRRVEVVFPVRDEACRQHVLRTLDLQLADTRKARDLAAGANNRRVPADGPPVRSQASIRAWLAQESGVER